MGVFADGLADSIRAARVRGKTVKFASYLSIEHTHLVQMDQKSRPFHLAKSSGDDGGGGCNLKFDVNVFPHCHC